MQISFYIEGGLSPAAYDYDMLEDGVLEDCRHQIARNRGTILIVLKRGKQVPTAEQDKAIGNIKKLHPAWNLTFFFSEREIALLRGYLGAVDK